MSINKQKLVWTLSCLSALTGCSSLYSGKEYSALHVNPVMNVRHADTSAENLYHQGRYFHRLTRYTKAIEAYQKAIAVNPDHVEAHNGLGILYSTQGQHELALEHFQKAIRIAPSATYLYNNLGYTHLMQGENSEAVAAFQEALNFDPDNHRARRNLATAQKRMGLIDGMALFSPMTKEAEKITASVPQTLTVQQNSDQQQLVQVAPNVYEFRIEQKKSQPATTAAPLTAPAAAPITAPATTPVEAAVAATPAEVTIAAAPVTASPVISTINLTPLPHDEAEKSIPENSFALPQNKRIEVSNGNGVTGMARNIATFLKQFGFNNSRLTNHQTFQQTQTEIHYRPNAHLLAEHISQIMPGEVKMIENNALREDTHLKVLLGKDISDKLAHFTHEENIHLAQNTVTVTP